MIGRDARARVDRIEAKLRPAVPPFGPLSTLERRELVQLEAEHRARFPGSPEQWDLAMCDDYIAYSAGRDGDGVAQRLAELRHRALPASEQAEVRANAIAIAAMSADELDEWMAEAARAAQEFAAGSSPSGDTRSLAGGEGDLHHVRQRKGNL